MYLLIRTEPDTRLKYDAAKQKIFFLILEFKINWATYNKVMISRLHLDE